MKTKLESNVNTSCPHANLQIFINFHTYSLTTLKYLIKEEGKKRKRKISITLYIRYDRLISKPGAKK